MEYVNDIYSYTYIKIMTFDITRIMSYIFMSFRIKVNTGSLL